MAVEERLAEHDRSIGVIEGKLDGLATKEFVKDEIQKQTIELQKQTRELSDKIDALAEMLQKERDWRMKVTGAASILSLLFVGITTLAAALINAGII